MDDQDVECEEEDPHSRQGLVGRPSFALVAVFIAGLARLLHFNLVCSNAGCFNAPLMSCLLLKGS